MSFKEAVLILVVVAAMMDDVRSQGRYPGQGAWQGFGQGAGQGFGQRPRGPIQPANRPAGPVPATQRPAAPQQPVGPPVTTRVKFLILGAGAAGLQAAETLVEKGETDFLVLEAANTYGGRIRDVHFAGVTVEIGADSPKPLSEMLDSSVRGLGARMRLHKPDWQSMSIMSADGQTNLTREAMRLHTWPRTAHALTEGLNLAEELWESHDLDMSVRAAFNSIGWLPSSALDRTMEWLHFDYHLGDVPRVASLKSHAFDAPELIIPRGPNANPHRKVTEQRGFKSYFEDQLLFMQNPTSVTKILYNKHVVEVNYGSPRDVTVTCKDGSIFIAERVICTFSLGVLQKQVVRFVPELPGWKTRELNRFAMGAHTKIYMEFPYTFWGNKEFILRVADRRGDFPLFVDIGSRIPELRRANKHVLMAEITGDEARRIDGQSKIKTRDEVMQVLRRMFDFSIPNPLDVYVSGWNANPLAMGSYSMWSPSVEAKCFAKIQTRLGRLHFAGEYTSLRFSGHIQGAIESGSREGESVFICSTGGTCPQASEGVGCHCTGTAPTQISGSTAGIGSSAVLVWCLCFFASLSTVFTSLY